jgi:hypothetical protein
MPTGNRLRNVRLLLILVVGIIATSILFTVGCRKHISGPRLDINQATEAQMDTLPGFSTKRSLRVIQLRPWDSTHQLVEKGILSQVEFERISDSITAR